MAENYAYKVRDRQGKLVTGEVWGDNDAAVIARLREMGYTPIKVGKKREGMGMEINLRPGHVKPKEIAIFSRQFATMVNSGLPILRALSILANQTASKALSKVVTQVRMDVERGSSLSAAMTKHPKAFLTSYLVCEGCGCHLQHRRDVVKRKTYRRYSCYGRLPERAERCTMPTLNAERAEGQVWDFLAGIIRGQ